MTTRGAALPLQEGAHGSYELEPKSEATVPPHHANQKYHHKRSRLPFWHVNSNQVTPGIAIEGESYRSGIHPIHFLRICFKSTSELSMVVNVLWPFVPAAIALHFARPDQNLWIFILNFIAIVPAANLIGFGGQELARKLPKVFGVLLEVTLGSVVEIILFMVFITSDRDQNIQIIKAAILGSILANLLLCLGACFFAGGLRRDEQEFHDAISEVGSGLMLVAGMGLVVPAVFSTALSGASTDTETKNPFADEILKISRATAVVLLFAYLIYVWFQMHTHHGLYDELYEADEKRDADRHKDLHKAKLTFSECLIALVIGLACVSLSAVFLVEQIHYINKDRGLSDAFVGLILVPLVEKAAEHLTAVDEAWDNQMNFALSHVLGASIQTALLNTPLVVIVGWGLQKPMDLNFEVFHAVVLILGILVVGNFLRDGKSNYLEGVLCMLVYIIIAVSAFYYPDPAVEGETTSGGGAARLLSKA